MVSLLIIFSITFINFIFLLIKQDGSILQRTSTGYTEVQVGWVMIMRKTAVIQIAQTT